MFGTDFFIYQFNFNLLRFDDKNLINEVCYTCKVPMKGNTLFDSMEKFYVINYFYLFIL